MQPAVTDLSVCHIVSPAKMAEPIEMPFGFRTRVGWAVMFPNVKQTCKHLNASYYKTVRLVINRLIFTARRSYASAVLGVVILSVRLSVCHTHAL